MQSNKFTEPSGSISPDLVSDILEQTLHVHQTPETAAHDELRRSLQRAGFAGSSRWRLPAGKNATEAALCSPPTPRNSMTAVVENDNAGSAS